MKGNRIIYIGCIICLLVLSACGNSTCPDGSTPIRDPEGNIIDCFDPLSQVEQQNDPLCEGYAFGVKQGSD